MSNLNNNNNIDVKTLDSNRVFYYFEEINKIPRGSFNEKAISEYLIDFAKKHNLKYTTDEIFNVVIKKDATLGYENAPVVAIQGHTDMVCEKNKGVEHDFEKDAIKVIYEGDFVRADRTTLGADNGIAVSMALAILEADNLSHPAIEAIFTSCEEVGMDGAMALDVSDLKSKIFLNIDSEDEGVFTVGCAGGAKGDITLKLDYDNLNNSDDYNIYCLSLSGLMGGHSGIDINKNRGNSNKLLIRALNQISNKLNIYMNNISGGSKDNAIPREAEANIIIKSEDAEKLVNLVNELDKIYKDEYGNTDENINLSLDKLDKLNNLDNKKVFTKETFNKIITLLSILPNGVQTMNTDIEGLVESSLNIGVIRMLDENTLEIVTAVRSGKSSKKQAIIEEVEIAVEAVGGEIKFRGNYPAWEYNKNSTIREKCKEVHKKLTGEEAHVEIIHAGLECGLFYEKMPTLDLISFGPNLYDIHTPDEKASISSIDRVYKFTLELLKALN